MKFFYSKRLINKYFFNIFIFIIFILQKKRKKYYLNVKGNQTNINRIAFDLNNEKNEIKKIIKKPIRRKNTNRKIINYKKSKYNIDNSYYTINLESEEKNKKREESDMKDIELNNDNFKIMSNLGRK